MSGRHESWQVRQWAPTALNAVVALVPTGAMLSAAGAAGTGYLLHRPDIAAAGAGTAAVGLAVERLQNRNLRIRSRRERWEWRAEREQLRESLDDLRRDLEEAHHTLNVLRSRIHTLNERAAETPRPAFAELATRQRLARQVAADDVPTMPLRRVSQPAAAGPLSVNSLHGNPFLPSPFRPVQAQPAVTRPALPQPVPEQPAPARPRALPLPTSPLRPRPSVTASAAWRPTPAEPERRRPLVTLARQQAVPGTDGWPSCEPAFPPAPAVLAPAVSAPETPAPGGRAPAAGPVAGAIVEPGGKPLGAGNHAGVERGLVTGPIALGLPADPPHLPVSSVRPAGSAHPADGRLPLLPPGPRDPVSGPLAIVVDLAEGSRASTLLPSATFPVATTDAMVYAAIDQADADELAVTLERLDDSERGGRHAGQVWSEDGTQPSGLMVVGASVVGDPQARAKRSPHPV